jgi:3'-5' exoribonuclease
VHILLSHHGKLEWGSPIRPAFPEAIAVFHADNMDSKLTQIISSKEDAITEEDFIYTKNFGNIYLK